MNNSDEFFLNKRLTGVHDTERWKTSLSNFELDIIDWLYNKLKKQRPAFLII